eukprot:COSAG01_NODE_8745_length_2674_cov_2.404660_3_plen_240_part_00
MWHLFLSRNIETQRPGPAGRGVRVLLHTDAAQSIGKVPVKANELGVDMITVVGHKFGAPKGIAVLYVRDGTPYESLLRGGGQESGRRAGTENVLLIAAIGKAAEVVEVEGDAIAAHMCAMRERLLGHFTAAFGEAQLMVNGPTEPSQRLPNTLSLGIKDVRASELLAELSEHVAASASAACHTGSGHAVSAILQACQVPYEFARGTLRLSVGRHTTEQEIDAAASLMIAAAKKQLVNAK